MELSHNSVFGSGSLVSIPELLRQFAGESHLYFFFQNLADLKVAIMKLSKKEKRKQQTLLPAL